MDGTLTWVERLIILGIVGQLGFAVVAIVGAFLLSREMATASGPMVIVGIFAIPFSIVFFGGVFGALGGLLSVAGGATAWPRAPA